MRRWSPFVLLAATMCAVAPTLAACATANTPSTNDPEWKLCGDIECTTISVPVNWQKPTDNHLTLHVVRHRAQAGNTRIGTLVVNPGGPGLPGSTMVLHAQQFLSPDIIHRFDIVSWDPRGTGESRPTFSCDTFDVVGLLNAHEAFAHQSKRVNKCASDNKLLIAHVATVDSARDLQAIVNALHEKTVTFLGYSYGSLLGASWSSLFPQAVRALVFDAPPSPQQQWQQDLKDTSHRIRDLWKAFNEKYSVDTVGLDEQLLARASVAALTNRDLWPSLAAAIQERNSTSLANLWSDYQYHSPDLLNDKNLVGARYATQCSDNSTDQRATAPLQIPHDTTAVERIVNNDFVCGLWPSRSGLPTFTNSTAPALIIGGTDDPITPLTYATELAQVMPHSQLLTVRSYSHTNYLVNKCVTSFVDTFLLTARLPERSVCS